MFAHKIVANCARPSCGLADCRGPFSLLVGMSEESSLGPAPETEDRSIGQQFRPIFVQGSWHLAHRLAQHGSGLARKPLRRECF